MLKKILIFACSLVAIVGIAKTNVNAASTSWNFKDSNFKSLGTISSTKTVDGLGLIATSSKTMKVKANSVKVSGTKYTYCLSLGGAGSTKYRAVKVPVSGKSTIKVILDAASSRTLIVADEDGKVSSLSASSTAALKSYTYNGDSDYVYLYSSGSNINIYKIQVDTSGSSSTTTTKKTTTKATTTKAGTTTKKTTTKATTTKTTTTTAKTTTEKIVSNAIYASNNGSGNGSSASSPTSLSNALAQAKAGRTVYLLSGTYKLSSTITLSASGTSSSRINLFAYNGTVTFDYSNQSLGDSNRGLVIAGNYWYIKGITITKAGDNGFFIAGHNNIIEMCVADGNRDSGFQISRKDSSVSSFSQWPSNNLIKNCTSRNNSDPKTGENADGFAAKLTCGNGNVFDGCIAHNNVDDGWDLYAKSATGSIGVVTIKNCIAYRNGQTVSGTMTKNSDGNGFKLGGSGVGTPHVVENCISFENKAHGFTDNNNPTSISIKNCTSFNNSRYGGKANFQCDRAGSGATYSGLLSVTTSGSVGSDKFKGKISNSVFFNSSKYYLVTSQTSVSSSKAGSETAKPTASAFQSVSSPSISFNPHTGWRNSDGSINTQGFLKITSSTYSNMGARNLSK